ncbi:poly-gamma-glutamate synthesis protein (capsule biosynthesis protein) [Peptoclostridium litorale DSM 5388]|uniref:PGA biosynthesis protein CapA n=1 Tax=Peptoclostridium litorale DSM 5388 TaxID=1121324 RepID=A0A069RKC9_PEPLI|nr:CapA family protein [Peptoclostridium litorale]KDR94657.1 PGA biosynthesis protein CapA [Peptoclostridium litorale DSM 5388]SIO30171.1 poly-gamma-glutamate synthesis protein (capsule biosynthesis protein) [Peptoclostridium litorale DSM 5388]
MRIAFLGDIGFLGGYTFNNNGGEKLKSIAKLLSSYDYVVGNLETPFTSKNQTVVPKSMHLKADKDNIELLKLLNVKAVTLGNNHICDYGIKGLEDTIAVLEKNNIDYFGVNNKNLRLKYNGNKISFSGFCCYSANGSNYINGKGVGINALTNKNITQQMESDEKDKYLSVLSLHWGDEHTNYPNKNQIQLSRKIAENKNIIIHGHHTHTIQGIEQIHGSLIAYSLGNFCFDDCTSPFVKNFTVKKNEDNKESYILSIEIENNSIVKYEAIGIYDSERGIVLKDNSRKIDLISREIKNYNREEYEIMRSKQISDTRKEKFGKRDFKWLMSKMNYYSIGSRLGTFLNAKRSNKVYKNGY